MDRSDTRRGRDFERRDGSREICINTLSRRSCEKRTCGVLGKIKFHSELRALIDRLPFTFLYLRTEMGVNPLKWKARNFVYVLLSFLVLYVLFVHKRVHHVTFEATIKNSKPESIWEFVADFSNMKKLNPTIEDFHILKESGNLANWKYSVQYTEHMSHIPAIQNTAQGHYSVRPDGEGFLISSDHRTFFFTNFLYVDSVSEFSFHKVGRDTKCTESVQYECPIAFSILCHKEVMYQRQEIMKRLEEHFTMSDTIEKDDK